MIIRSLHVENLLQFEVLSLDDVSRQGIIGIASVSHTHMLDILHFAFFGEAYSGLSQRELLHKNSDYCSVSIDFSHNGEYFQLMRTFDIEGSAAALLLDEEGNLLVEQGAIEEKLDKQFFHNRQQFFQQHFLTVDTVKKNDVDIYTRLKLDDFYSAYEAIEQQDQACAVEESSPSEQEARLASLKLNETWLPELVDTRETLEERQHAIKNSLNHLDDFKQHYQNDYQRYHKHHQHYQIFNTFANVFLPINMLVWTIWACFIFAPNLIVKLLSPALYNELATWLVPTSFAIGSVIIIAYGVSLIYSWWLDSKRLQPAQQSLSKQISELEYDYELSEQVPTISQAISQWLTVAPLFPPSTIKPATFKLFLEQISHYDLEPHTVQKLLVSLQSGLKRQRNTTQECLKSLNLAIHTEMDKSQQAARIRQQLQAAKTEQAQSKEHHATRCISQRLLIDAAQASYEPYANNINHLLSIMSHGQFDSLSINKDFEVILSRSNAEESTTLQTQSTDIQEMVNFVVQCGLKLSNQTGFFVLALPNQNYPLDALLDLFAHNKQQIWLLHNELPHSHVFASHIRYDAETLRLSA